MSITELFNVITERGNYKIGYLIDGWTQEVVCDVSSPMEAQMITQNIFGSICGVTFVERI